MPCSTLLSLGVFFRPSYIFRSCCRCSPNFFRFSTFRSVKTSLKLSGLKLKSSYVSTADSGLDETTRRFYICISILSEPLNKIWCISSTIYALDSNLLTLISFLSLTIARFRYKSRLPGPLLSFSSFLHLRQRRKKVHKWRREYSKLRLFMIAL